MRCGERFPSPCQLPYSNCLTLTIFRLVDTLECLFTLLRPLLLMFGTLSELKFKGDGTNLGI